MLVKTGLLVVSNPKQIGNILSTVQKKVKNTLYIQLLSALTEPFGSFHSNVFSSWPKYSQTIHGIYSQAATHCHDLDVRVLLSGLKYKNLAKIQTQRTIELVIFDKLHNQNEIDNFVKAKISNITQECKVVTMENCAEEFVPQVVDNGKMYSHTVLGGTFDRLHHAHKLLLSEAALRSSSKLTVGVTEENMLEGKTLWELIQSIETRVDSVNVFLKDICPELETVVVPISDVFGPTQHDPTMELLVVSAETARGGQKVNEVRQSKGLPILDVLAVNLIDDPHRQPVEEEKISSSSGRMRLLGTLLKPVESNRLISSKPYIIGLTGGIASGKSGVGNHLRELGAEVIDCDKVGHGVYQKGKPCHSLIVKTFGKGVLDNNGEIDRKKLGPIVFNNPNKLQQLNSIVWPAIIEEVRKIITGLSCDVVVVEAAVLLTAGWQKYCHETWTTIIQHDEAIKRLRGRSLNEEQAKARIASQPSNQEYVEASHVLFCSYWPVEYTRLQVHKAWNELQQRL